MSPATDKPSNHHQQNQPILADVLALAGEIGPRGTGSPEEAAAADYVTGRLTALGLAAERRIFQAVPSQNSFALAINWVALVAVIIYPLGGPLSRWIATGLALSTAPMLWQTIRTSNNPLRFLLPKVTSQNVLTRINPSEVIKRHVVLLAHLDTNRCRKVWASSTVRYLEPLAYLTLTLLACLGLLFLAGALLGGPGWVWWTSLPLAGYVAGAMISLWVDDRTPFSPGAHDNAASVAVALEIGRRLVSSPLENTQVWLAFTGAEETDHAGLKVLLHEHDAVMHRAAFIGLEGLGSGEIVILTKQGLCAHYRPDPELLALAGEVANDNQGLDVHPGQMTMEDEVGTLRRRGYQAICIAGMDPETGSLPHWHRVDDTVDSISEEVMGKAASFVTALLRKLDKRLLRDDC
jgi:acetylornithine deacetylase/succinyl-diaminopimelate desuccinylase-like protein